jgi:hypothetical protein
MTCWSRQRPSPARSQTETEHVGGAEGDASAAGDVGEGADVLIAPSPAAPAERTREMVGDKAVELDAGNVADHDGGEMGGRGGVGVSRAGIAPEGRAEGDVVDTGGCAVETGRLDGLGLAVDIAGVVAADAGGHGQHLAEPDAGHARVGKGECLGREEGRGEDTLVEAFGKEVGALLEEDAGRDAAEALA